MSELTFESRQFDTAGEAIQYTEAGGGVAIRMNCEYLVVSQEDADRLASAGVPFAYLFEYLGRVMTVPVDC